MRDLLYFSPDPQVPDADMLGIGELIYSDGTTQYVANDPEIVMGLPPPPPGVTPQKPIGQPPPMEMPQQQPAPQMQAPPQSDMPPMQQPAPVSLGNGMQADWQGNISETTDPMTGMVIPQSTPATPQQQQSADTFWQDPVKAMGQPQGQPMQAQQTPSGMPPIQQPPPTDIGDGMQADWQGNILQGGQPMMQQGGMIPVQREGALPPEMAQRQLSELGAQQGATLQATEQARADEVRLMNQLTLQQMAANEAERHSREQDIADQTAKMERWQQEQQEVVDSGIETDLISARGPVAAVMLALGATLLGAAGNDTGLRMIDKQIDTHIRQQVARRDTKLGILSNQIGSSMQAVALGKAALYKVAADKVELLAQKTKNDVYESQTPAVVEQLRQKQLENMQAAEQMSIGKTLEKAPLPPKPPSAEMLEKYGKLRRERAGSDSITQRMDSQLGLIWNPGQGGQQGHYQNSDEVLKKGIQGTGNFEQLLPDLVYSTLGGWTAEGRQVRGASEAMAFAQLRAVQPVGVISDADIERAVKIGALDTEAGLLQGLERMHVASEQQTQMDVQQYGPDVVGEYERRGAAQGQQPQRSPAASRPAAAADVRAQMTGMKQQPSTTMPAPSPDRPQAASVQGGAEEDLTPQEFKNATAAYAESAGLNPESVWRIVKHESGGKPGAVNKLTNKHAGLIQFSQETWKGLAKDAGRPDISWDDMRKMTREEQLPFVMQYFSRQGLGPNDDAGEYAMAAFMPYYRKRPDDFVLGRKGSKERLSGLSMGKIWEQNPNLRNGDTITVGDVRRSAS